MISVTVLVKKYCRKAQTLKAERLLQETGWQIGPTRA
jgi:hypothetical protein